jgi:hypothetical protein
MTAMTAALASCNSTVPSDSGPDGVDLDFGCQVTLVDRGCK